MPGRAVKHDEQCEARRITRRASEWVPCSCADRAYEQDPYVDHGEIVRRDFNR
jgi:hypothetical protein